MENNYNYEFVNILQRACRLDWSRQLTAATQTEFLALSIIRHFLEQTPDCPGIYVSQLAKHMQLSVSMVSKMLKVLEDKGWITRTIDADSRRNTFVALTEEGIRVHELVRAQMNEIHQRVAERLGKDSMGQLISTISRALDCYEAELSAD